MSVNFFLKYFIQLLFLLAISHFLEEDIFLFSSLREGYTEISKRGKQSWIFSLTLDKFSYL